MSIEITILNFIQYYVKSTLMDNIMIFITSLADGGWIWISLAMILIFFKRTRTIGIAMLIAIVLEVITCNFILKPLIARPRPFESIPNIKLLIDMPIDYSFPSGHAAVSFAGAITLAIYRSKLALPAVVLAGLISFSRIYLYVHYPSDILAGIIIGSVCAVLSSIAVKKWYHPQN